MTVRRVFLGHIDRAKSSSVRTGGRQEVLIVMVDPQEASALKATLPADLHRSQSIPIAFVVGGPGETLSRLPGGHDAAAETAPDAPQPAPVPPEQAGRRPDVFERILDVLVQIHANIDQVNADTRSVTRDVALLLARSGR